MILIADSGSTKTHWCIFSPVNGLYKEVFTEGINPFYQSVEDMETCICRQLLSHIDKFPTIEKVFFYGAGCTPAKAPLLHEVLSRLFLQAEIHVHTDLLAAARALCGHDEGIACIMGTGSNSCYYDGTEIRENVSPLGFILGDEGSGAVLGKLLVADVLKRQLPESLMKTFFARFQTDSVQLMDAVYRRPFPNRYLAGFAVFYAENPDSTDLQRILQNNFRAFVSRNLMQYHRVHEFPVHFTGSVAYYYADTLRQVLTESGLQLGTIMHRPMDGLLHYHGLKDTSK